MLLFLVVNCLCFQIFWILLWVEIEGNRYSSYSANLFIILIVCLLICLLIHFFCSFGKWRYYGMTKSSLVSSWMITVWIVHFSVSLSNRFNYVVRLKQVLERRRIEASVVVIMWKYLFQRNDSGNGQGHFTDDQSFAGYQSQCFHGQWSSNAHS